MSCDGKPLVWLHGEIRTPPLSRQARLDAGMLLRRLQRGEEVGMPHARRMSTGGPHCYEMRMGDCSGNWRVIYRIDTDAIIIVEVFRKTTRRPPRSVIEQCRLRLSK